MAPKNQSQRNRNKKLSWKQRIPIKTGAIPIAYDDDFTDTVANSPRANGAGKDSAHVVETGVDKEEESEHHLQMALKGISNAAIGSGNRKSAANSKAPVPHIPTPDATGLVNGYQKLYKSNVYIDPFQYIKSSETVEDLCGVNYNMDEDDEDWLEDFNKQFETSESALVNGSSDPSKVGRVSPRKDKGKEVADSASGKLSEDDFEVIMDAFETATSHIAPTLHVDVSRIPGLADLEFVIAQSSDPKLSVLKAYFKSVYVHWKERKLKTNGKSVNPSLDHDVTKDNDPYVCFRGRDVKQARKTRRSDQTNLERLVRLRSDLVQVQKTIAAVIERERIKKESLDSDARVFAGRVAVRALKRKLGENDGDEDILIKKKDKFKMPRLSLAGINTSLANQGGTRIILNRSAVAQPSATYPVPETSFPYIDLASQIAPKIERDIARKRELDSGWEDYSDHAFLPMLQQNPARYWRTPEIVTLRHPGARADEQVVEFDGYHPTALVSGPITLQYRKRIGRGGRLLLDRISARANKPDRRKDEDEDSYRARLERWRYDSDITSDFPAANDPVIVDDYSTDQMLRRIKLISGTKTAADEWSMLGPSESYLTEAMAELEKADKVAAAMQAK